MVQLEKISGLKPLKNRMCKFSYEDYRATPRLDGMIRKDCIATLFTNITCKFRYEKNRATPLNYHTSYTKLRIPKILVEKQNRNYMMGRSPILFVEKMKTNHQGA